ncbi:MAG: hypothetical protein M1828_005920 [Chrysothrix sp. TS-e1954]|nr:MAG: hypothetical protein M1828_005920 [Chrysothrix sp. TS-e1954]
MSACSPHKFLSIRVSSTVSRTSLSPPCVGLSLRRGIDNPSTGPSSAYFDDDAYLQDPSTCVPPESIRPAIEQFNDRTAQINQYEAEFLDPQLDTEAGVLGMQPDQLPQQPFDLNVALRQLGVDLDDPNCGM